MPAGVSLVERVRAEVDQLFASDQDLSVILEQVARLSVRLVLQAALEAEVTAFLGRDRYQRDPDARPGYRNGHQPVTVKTTSGPIVLERPKLRGADATFASRLLGKGVTRTHALEALVIAGYVRGLSTRDIEASLARGARPRGGPVAFDGQPGLCEAFRASSSPGGPARWSAWTRRTCSWTAPRSATTTAPGLSRCCAPGRSPPTASRSWLAWMAQAPSPPMPDWGSCATWSPVGWVRRCWSSPTAPPGWSARSSRSGRPRRGNAAWSIASATSWPRSPRPTRTWSRPTCWRIFDDLPGITGEPAFAEARRRAEVFARRWGGRYPRAVACVLDDFAELTAHLRFPAEHWSRIRHSNLIERTFGETRPRVKVIGRLPGERSWLSLVWACWTAPVAAGAGWTCARPTSACCNGYATS